MFSLATVNGFCVLASILRRGQFSNPLTNMKLGFLLTTLAGLLLMGISVMGGECFCVCMCGLFLFFKTHFIAR